MIVPGRLSRSGRLSLARKEAREVTLRAIYNLTFLSVFYSISACTLEYTIIERREQLHPWTLPLYSEAWS